MDITLIGTSHLDINEHEDLTRLLIDLNPSIIAVEYSSKLHQLNEKSNQRFIKWIEMTLKRNKVCEEFSKSFIELMKNAKSEFEHSCAKEYCQTYEIPLHLIDNPTFARIIKANEFKEVIPKVKSIPGNEFIGPISLVDESLGKRSKSFYQFLKTMLNEKDNKLINIYLNYLEDRLFVGAIGERDLYMADRIRDIVSNNKNSRLICIVGGNHMLDDPKYKRTLYSKIQDLNPKRIILGEPEIIY